MAVTPATEDEIGQALALIRAEQVVPARGTAYLSALPAALEVGLERLYQPWRRTLRVALDAHGTVVGASLVAWDIALDRAWVSGPWVSGSDEQWAAHAEDLLDAALDQVPEGITDVEVSACTLNGRLGALVGARGWRAAEPDLVFSITREGAAGWSTTDPERVRPATTADIPLVQLMHEAEFPATYASAEQIVRDQDRITLVVEGADGAALGYCSGHVESDGSGFLDFMSVHPAARGVGDGHRLLQAASADLLRRSRNGVIRLVVSSHRRPAIDFYEAHGFVHERTFQAYRSG